MLDWIIRRKKVAPEGLPLSVILRDRDASEKLHLYLLSSLNKDRSQKISVDGRNFVVGVVEVNPAPTIGSGGPSMPSVDP